jgi:hypothetical protein
MSSSRHQRVILGLLKRNFPHLLQRAKAIYNALLANPNLFANPSPSLATLLKKIQAFDEAQQLAGTHAAGAAGARNDLAEDLIKSLETARNYLQDLVDSAPDQAQTLAGAAAMTLARATSYSKPVLQARQDQPSVAVELIAHVALLAADTSGRIFFNWQCSSDGGKTWGSLPSTPHGRTDVPGLTALTTYCFRVSVTHGKGTDPWTDSVSLLVR